VEQLNIAKTKDSLGIDCDPVTGIVDMVGSSYPEDALGFFQPLCSWIEKYIRGNTRPVILNLKIDYLNTSSSKSFFDIFDMLDEYVENGGTVQVNWHYKKDDIDILETGREFSEDLKLRFEFIEYD